MMSSSYQLLRQFVCLLTLFLLPFCASAVCTAQGDSTIAIKQVKVGAKHIRGVIPHHELNDAEIRRSAAQNVAEALRLLAGVQVKDYGGIGGLKTVNVRSMGSQHVAVSYDGAMVGNAQNGIVDLGRFSLDNVERIALYHGQQTSLLQSARDHLSGALVAIHVRRPRVSPQQPYQIQPTFRTGSYGLINPQVHYEQHLKANLALSLNGEVIEAHGRYPFRYVGYNSAGQKVYDTTAVRQNGDVHIQRIEAALYRQIEAGEWQLRAYAYHSRRGLPGPIVNNVWQRGERLTDNTVFTQFKWQKEFSTRYRTKLLVKYAYSDTHYRQLDPRFYAANLLYKQHEAYISSVHAFQFASWLEGTLAYDLLWNMLESHDRLRHSPPLGFSSPHQTTHYVAALLAFHYSTFLLRASAVTTGAYRREQQASESPAWHLCPALFASYSLPHLPSLSFYAFWKQTLRHPTFNELYYTGWGNRALKPEFTQQRSAGARWHYVAERTFFKEVTLQTDVYNNSVYNKIIAYPTRGQFHWTTVNLGKVAMRGLECSLLLQTQTWHRQNFSLRLQYAYSEARDLTDPRAVYYRHQIPYIPWHSGAAVFSYTWRSYSLYYSFLYTGERYHLPENSPFNYEPAWYTSDLAVALNFNIFAHTILLRLELNNLLDQQYAVVLNYPMPGRNFRVTLQTTFE